MAMMVIALIRRHGLGSDLFVNLCISTVNGGTPGSLASRMTTKIRMRIDDAHSDLGLHFCKIQFVLMRPGTLLNTFQSLLEPNGFCITIQILVGNGVAITTKRTLF